MSVFRSFVAVAVVAGSMFVVGCAQTSSPTSPAAVISGASTAVPPSSVAVPLSAIDAL